MGEEPLDADWLARLGRNDAAALGELYDRYSPRIFGLLTHILSSRDEAEEILLEVFQRLCRESRSLAEQGSSVSAWLVVAAREAALERSRRRRRSISQHEDTRESVGTDKRTEKTSRATKASASISVSSKATSKPSEARTPAGQAIPGLVTTRATAPIPPAWMPRPGEVAVIDDRLDLLQKVINQLPKSQRQALEFAVFKGLGEAEIAAELGEPLGKVRTGLRAAVTFVKHRRRAVLGTWAANI
jgi:RNA polymerase sigma-70 factor (ECF subfamily)